MLMGLIKFVVVDGIYLSVFNMMDHNGTNSITINLRRVITGTNKTRVSGGKHCSFFATNYKSSWLLWDFTQDVMVIPHRRFGINYRSHFQGSRDSTLIDPLTLEGETVSFSRNVGKELRTIRCVTSQKSAYLIVQLL